MLLKKRYRHANQGGVAPQAGQRDFDGMFGDGSDMHGQGTLDTGE